MQEITIDINGDRRRRRRRRGLVSIILILWKRNCSLETGAVDGKGSFGVLFELFTNDSLRHGAFFVEAYLPRVDDEGPSGQANPVPLAAELDQMAMLNPGNRFLRQRHVRAAFRQGLQHPQRRLACCEIEPNRRDVASEQR